MFGVKYPVSGLSYPILLIAFSLMVCFTGCSKNKFSCEGSHAKNSTKIKKNKSRYNALYSPKLRPVPKNYVLKNGR